MKFRNIAVNVALILFSIVFALVAVELVLRISGYKAKYGSDRFMEDAELVVVNRPGADTTLGKQEYKNSIHINSRGLRDYEHTKDTAGDIVILGIGDSFTFGDGAEFEETYLRRLELLLNDGTSGTVEVVKAGVSAYDTEVESRYLERLLPAYKPDLVILGFTTNDVADVAAGGISRYGVTDTGILYDRKSALGELFASTFVGRLYYRTTRKLEFIKDLKKLGKSPVARGDGWLIDFTDMYRMDHPGHIEKAWSIIRESILRMRDDSLAAGAEFLVVYIPLKDQLREKSPEGYDFRLPEKLLAGFCKEVDIPLYDPLDALVDTGRADEFYYELDGHFRPEGYEFLAEGIRDYLVSNGMLKQRASEDAGQPGTHGK